MAKVRRCDICGKLEPEETAKMAEFDLFALYDPITRKEVFEVCQDCKRELLAKIEQMRQEKGYKEI